MPTYTEPVVVVVPTIPGQWLHVKTAQDGDTLFSIDHEGNLVSMGQFATFGGALNVGGVVKWYSGSEAPTLVVSDGSLYSCISAGLNSGLWVREDGVWVHK
jgi:hypothetical protein